ncbi:MAG: tetratricopeptide repeat protein [Rhodanobacteraceae bacterium]
MSIWFFVIAAVMLAVALACVLVPLLRAGRRVGSARAPFVLALILVFALPPLALGLYALIGTPQALQVQDNGGPGLVNAAAQLRAKLQQAPNDRDGWILLGQAYSALERPADARDALAHALKLAPDNPDIMIAYVEADAQARADHRIDGDTRRRLQRAIALNPDQQRGLWLLGISDYQLSQYGDAATHWRHLLDLLPADSRIADAVKAQIALAQARAAGKTQAQAEGLAQAVMSGSPANASSTATADDPAPDAQVALKVEVRLDPKLALKVSPGDTLFVYARANDGPPMPLAVARLHASDLPATVTLTDALAMTPQLKLSMFPRVRVSARISKSGNALPQAGDLEAPPVQIATDSREPVTLTIDRVH